MDEIKTDIKPVLSVQRMLEIVKSMRRPVPPQEISGNPDDHPKIIEDLKVLDDGTVRTYISGEEYPIRFFTPHEAVDVVAGYKKLFSELIKSGFWGIAAIWFFRKVWSNWLQRLFGLYPIVLKDEHWSQPVKELRRVLRLEHNILDAISLVFENDMAYRYRMQDVLGELDKKLLVVNPIKEIERLLDILVDRDYQNNKPLWKPLRKYAWLLRFYGLKQIKSMLLDLKVEDIKFDECDLYWIKINKSYNWNGGK